MTFKRLYWDFALHGGSVGAHPLAQGSSYEHQLFFEGVLVYVFSPTLTNNDVDLGTALQPQLLFGNFDFTGLSTGQMLLTAVIPAESLFSSQWQIRFNTTPETGGNLEFIFDSHRRQ